MTNEPQQEPATDDGDRIPAVTVEWTAPPGEVRRATLSLLGSRRFWLRTGAIGLVVGVVVAVVCIATGSGWPLGLLIAGAFFVGLTIEMVLMCLLGAYLQNRKVLGPGAHWGAGSDATRIRIDNRINTIVIRRENIEGFRRVGPLFVLRLRPREVVAVPVALLESTLTDPAFARLID